MVEMGGWLVDTLKVPECSVCMDPVIGVFFFFLIFLTLRESIALTVVDLSFIAHVHISY